MARVQFIDLWGGAGALGTYNWPINHNEEDEGGLELSIERTATTNGTSFIRQIGEVSPETLRWKGAILQKAQKDMFDSFFAESNGLGSGPRRTIHLVDQLAQRAEVWFTSWKPLRHRASRNPRGSTADEKLVYWTYSAEFEVVRRVS